jgi:protocatechuate 4,5-dioxygenase alpha chain
VRALTWELSACLRSTVPKIHSARSGDLKPPPFDLDEPGTIEFTAERALAGQALNRFALSLRSPGGRAGFLADEPGYMRGFGLTAAEIALVTDRDWTGLLLAGGHLQAMLKLAATVGQDLWSIGAHNAGCGRDELIAGCPRTVSGLPETPEAPQTAQTAVDTT